MFQDIHNPFSILSIILEEKDLKADGIFVDD